MKITIFYDDLCVLCTTNSTQMRDKNPQDIRIVPVREAGELLEKAGVSTNDALTYLCVQDETGKMHMSMDAVRLVYRTANMGFVGLLSLPIISSFCDWSYPILARNRYRIPRFAIRLLYGKVVSAESCENSICQIPPSQRK